MTALVDPAASPADPPADPHAVHRTGVILVAIAAVAWSVSGVFARMIHVDVWTAMCLRALFAALYMAIGHVAVHRERSISVFATIGWVGLFSAACGTISMLAFIGAFFYTTVADVSVIYATTPFLAAAIGWLVIRERVTGRTLIASSVALVGIVIMVAGSFGTGRLFGDFLAFVMALSFAAIAVVVRARPTLEMLPINLLSCTATALVAMPFAHLTAAQPFDIGVLAVFAFTSTALAFFLFLAGARLIPAAEAGLITTLDVVLSPIWVFLIFSENPGWFAIAGGCVVLAAVVWHIAGGLRRP